MAATATSDSAKVRWVGCPVPPPGDGGGEGGSSPRSTGGRLTYYGAVEISEMADQEFGASPIRVNDVVEVVRNGQGTGGVESHQPYLAQVGTVLRVYIPPFVAESAGSLLFREFTHASVLIWAIWVLEVNALGWI